MLTPKTCNCCGIALSLDNARVRKNPTGTTRLNAVCKKCEYDQNRERFQANRDAYYATQKEYVTQNRQRVKAIKAASQSRRRATFRQQGSRNVSNCPTPVWGDRSKVKEFYDLAAWFRSKGVEAHVDHIAPLRAREVCGLHVHTNLRVVLASSNRKKGNRFDPGAVEK